MKTRHFLAALDKDRINQAIAAAERETSGRLRVFVSHRNVEDALEAAHARFVKLGMSRTAARNAVLIYIAPEAHKYAIIGDTGIHEKCGGDEFWQRIVDATMQPLLKQGRFTDAIVDAVAHVGWELAIHFPAVPGGTEQSPDQVAED